MRNLKRALSLAVASVMLLGMMVVGTGAYDDVTASHNEEAIAVMEAAGIMIGDDAGNFNPDQKVTRNQMAVVISNLMEYKVNNYAGLAPFVDVPAWAEKYVSACYSNGIVAGVDATHYNGEATVNATQAGLMIMKVLGYFQFAADFGTDWEMAVAAKGAEIGLYDGLSVGLRTELTRNDVAQMVLNALEAVVVKGTQSGTNASISAGEASIEIYGTITYDEQENEIYYNDDQDDEFEYLIEKLYGEQFTKTSGAHNDMGLRGTKWKDTEKKASEQEIIFVADKAYKTVIAEEETDSKQLYLDEVDEDYEGTAIVEKDVVAGDVVYYYKDGKNIIDNAVVHYTLIQVGESDDDVDDEDAEDGVTAYIDYTVAGDTTVNTINDTDFADFDYEEDDYVLAVIGEDDVILASQLAESVEGKITNKKGSDVKVDGKFYTDMQVYSAETLKVGTEAIYYLNLADQIIFVADIEEAKSDDYAYVYKIDAKESEDGELNEDGIEVDKTTTYTAYVALADGTKASYVIDKDSVALIDELDVIAYSINKDGELEYEASSDSIELTPAEALDKDNKFVTVDGEKVYANSKTEFVFAKANKDKKMVVETKTGVKNVEVAANTIAGVVYDEEDAVVLYVFVADEVAEAESDAKYAVVLDNEADEAENEDEEPIYTYAVAIDGKATTLTFEDEQSFSKGEIFAYTVTGDYAEVDEHDLQAGTVSYVGEDFYYIDSAMELLWASGEFTADDAELYTITYEEDGDISVKAATKLSKDDVVSFVANDDAEISIAFILVVED